MGDMVGRHLLLDNYIIERKNKNKLKAEAANLILRAFFLPKIILFYFIFKLYNIVLVLPNIKMNPP